MAEGAQQETSQPSGTLETVMADEDLWEWFGAPIIKNEKRGYKYVEPAGPPLTRSDYPTIHEYHRNFYDRYVEDKVYAQHTQKYDDRECSWKDPITLKPCKFTQKRFAFVALRQHFISHHKSVECQKYVCPRCNNNYGKYDDLLHHAEKGRCRIAVSDYPPFRFFIDEVAQFHPEQEEGSLICSKCSTTLSTAVNTLHHFYACARYTFPCFKCNATYSDYMNARMHYEKCDGKPSRVNTAFYRYNFTKPTDADDKVWTKLEMMKHIEDIALPKVEENLKAFDNGLAYFGQTAIPQQRFKVHRGCQSVFKRTEANPFIEDDDLILCRLWKRSDALKYEYLLQKHLTTPEGKFYHRMENKINVHCIRELIKEDEENEIKIPVYVYMVVTRRQYQPLHIDNIYNDYEQDTAEYSNHSSLKRKAPSDEDEPNGNAKQMPKK